MEGKHGQRESRPWKVLTVQNAESEQTSRTTSPAERQSQHQRGPGSLKTPHLSKWRFLRGLASCPHSDPPREGRGIPSCVHMHLGGTEAVLKCFKSNLAFFVLVCEPVRSKLCGLNACIITCLYREMNLKIINSLPGYFSYLLSDLGDFLLQQLSHRG